MEDANTPELQQCQQPPQDHDGPGDAGRHMLETCERAGQIEGGTERSRADAE
jgi:hypothetical protein